MKVCLISQNVSPGILIFRKDFIRYLVLQGHQVFAFAIDYTMDTEQMVRDLGAIPVSYQLNKTGMNPFLDIRDTYLLKQEIMKISPDVVFSFFVKPSIYGSIAAWFAGVPRIIAMLEGLGYIHTPTSRGVSFKKQFLKRVHGALCTLGYAFADKVLFLNSDDPKDLSSVALLSKKKLDVLGPIGLDLDYFQYSKPDLNKPVRFIFIARLLAEKGIFQYLSAARIVKRDYPNSEFVVLGGLDPDNPAALSKSELDKVIQEGIIIYPGHVNNVKEWIDQSHVFVLPSFYREGVPRSTQEAMAIGRAIITTDVPGCRETVVEGVNGFMVPPWDAECLADKMVYLIKNPDEIIRMGESSYQMAHENFDVKKINPELAKKVLGSL
ncbi:glycosyl transferase family 1 [Thiosulfatimonas sediminis]|uniref:Glycosyl transferase family 1 n=1 Tax=Thiosulfatimonas sediminis TaxID=2675054 RepID=A0A6F8PTC0_9GAMM|nr:glycosyltransferase family 4 protein [Thiosulfatimonas sediminis]BBP45274.1 glycosyl transferase family 1 [Thiosulfatimonas sediminis]